MSRNDDTSGAGYLCSIGYHSDVTSLKVSPFELESKDSWLNCCSGFVMQALVNEQPR